MTCIIAHRDGWMVADRRKTFQDTLLGPYVVNKIIRGPDLLVACAGAAEVSEHVRRALREANVRDALSRVQDVFFERPEGHHGHAIILQRGLGLSNRLYEVSSRGDLAELDSRAEFWAIGSGYLVALGYLKACSHSERIVAAHAIGAIEYSATLCLDVGDGCQVEHLVEVGR